MKRLMLLAATFALLLSPLSSMPATAVTASDWKAGNIMNDSVFTNSNAMTVSQIQSWLNARLENCDYWGTKRSELGGGTDYNKDGVVTRAEYGRTVGNPAPFTCLNKYYEVPKTSPSSTIPASNYGKSTKPSGSKSAAQLIYDAGKAYGISPKVLLVKLATESAGPLTSDVWPLKRQYTYAMGARCPDSGPGGSANCDVNYSGFSMQMREAASLMRWYLDSMSQSWWSYKKPYATNYILWNVVERGCGGSNVYIQNKATAALYTYTPYQPNSAALQNMYGSGNNCSAYGNRNFWRVYSDWFGSTQKSPRFVSMQDSRWMRTATATQKIHALTSESFGPILQAGRHIEFVDKILIDGEWLLRTRYDYTNKNFDGIPLKDLAEIQYEPITSEWLSMPLSSKKKDPVRNESFETIRGMTAVEVVDRIIVDGSVYYRTAYESSKNRYRSIPASRLEAFKFYNLLNPRKLYAQHETEKINVKTGGVVGTIPASTHVLYDRRITIDGVLYVQAATDHGTNNAVRFSDLIEADSIPFVGLTKPRTMKLKVDTFKRKIPSASAFGPELPAGMELYFPDKVIINSVWYLRTQWDKDSYHKSGIPLTDVNDQL